MGFWRGVVWRALLTRVPATTPHAASAAAAHARTHAHAAATSESASTLTRRLARLLQRATTSAVRDTRVTHTHGAHAHDVHARVLNAVVQHSRDRHDDGDDGDDDDDDGGGGGGGVMHRAVAGVAGDALISGVALADSDARARDDDDDDDASDDDDDEADDASDDADASDADGSAAASSPAGVDADDADVSGDVAADATALDESERVRTWMDSLAGRGGDVLPADARALATQLGKWRKREAFVAYMLQAFDVSEEMLHRPYDQAFVEALMQCSDGARVRELLSTLRGGKRARRRAREAASRELAALYTAYVQRAHADKCEHFRTLRRLSDLRQPHEWYPMARAMRRRVVYHAGPTNSGKTHTALARLRAAPTGMYLAPLRLLAFEVYDRLNASAPDGVPVCSLMTGDEQRIVDNASKVAMTVEMADVQRDFDVAVIDEVQMIGDADRGAAWTRALLGARAHEVHVCGDPSAIALVGDLVRRAGDDFSVERYTRLAPLHVEHSALNSDVRKLERGDAVITFSRANVYRLKQAIEEHTAHRCAVVYGRLPPEARAQQAALFNEGREFSVLVATDAVGMGLNLNIGRIVFDSTVKYDGERVSRVEPWQVKQIAGRAGRFGSDFDAGRVTCLRRSDLGYVQWALRHEHRVCASAGLAPTFEMIELFAARHPPHTPLAKLLDAFEEAARVDGAFFLCDLSDMKMLAGLTRGLKLTLKERFTFSQTPISTSDRHLCQYLSEVARTYASKHKVRVGVSVPNEVPETPEQLQQFELLYKKLEAYAWLGYA